MAKWSQTHPSAGWLSSKLTLANLWPMIVLAGVFYILSTAPIRPHDFWWHLKAGDEIVASGQIPTVDRYSFTMAGAHYDNYATFWLMEVAYHFLFAAGGASLVIFMHTLLITAAYAMLLRLCWKISESPRIAAAATLFAAGLGFYNWSVRPQAISFLAGATILTSIYAYRSRKRAWLLFVPPLAMLVWANCHGSFVVGLLMLGIWLADEAVTALRMSAVRHDEGILRQLCSPAAVLLASAIACLINPRGLSIIEYVLSMSANPVIQNLIPEWAPPTFSIWYGAAFLAALLLCAVILAVSPRRPSLFQILYYVTFGGLALKTARGIVWFGIAMAPVMAYHLEALFAANKSGHPGKAARRESALLNYLFAAILLVGIILGLPWFKHLLPLQEIKKGLISAETPVTATETLLKARPPGRIFNDLGFGSYLIWAAQPYFPVFIDARLELYPLEICSDYLDISAAREGWQGKLGHYGISTLMLSPNEQPALIKTVRSSRDWKLLYEDSAAVIFVKSVEHPS